MNQANFPLVASVYNRRRDDIRRIFLHSGISMHDTEDMVQDVFVRLLNVDTITPSTIDALVVTIAYNMRIDYFRKRRLALENLSVVQNLSDRSNDTYSIVACRELIRLEDAAISMLGVHSAHAYVMYRRDGMTTKKIAQVMNISQRTVEGHIYNSRRKVRTFIAAAL